MYEIRDQKFLEIRLKDINYMRGNFFNTVKGVKKFK